MHIMELTAQEIDRAIADINALIREPYRCAHGDFPWLHAVNLGNWPYALEQEGDVEIPSFYTLSRRTERVRRVFINLERRVLRELPTIDVEIAKVDRIGGAA
jgi:hypothetical protein